MKKDFMTQHPLREKLTSEDWDRIQLAFNGDTSLDSITVDEFEAGNDIMFDALAKQLQTHLGILALQ